MGSGQDSGRPLADRQPRRERQPPDPDRACGTGHGLAQLDHRCWVERLHEAASRRVIRQAPSSSGSSIQTARDVPTWAHWVALRSSLESGDRERLVSSQGATSANAGSEASAAQAVGNVNRATIAGAEDSATIPKATPMTMPATRKTVDWSISGTTWVHVPCTPATSAAAAAMATTAASVDTVITTLARSLAPMTRERTGTSVKVIIPVRCDHSEVTRRIPVIGSSTAAGCSPTSRTPAKV